MVQYVEQRPAMSSQRRGGSGDVTGQINDLQAGKYIARVAHHHLSVGDRHRQGFANARPSPNWGIEHCEASNCLGVRETLGSSSSARDNTNTLRNRHRISTVIGS